MAAPVILSGFEGVSLIPILAAGALAWGFWRTVVPRAIKGLQVAYPTGSRRYEVATVTADIESARELLSTPGMRYGVSAYVMALTGVLVLLLDFLMVQFGFSEGFHRIPLVLGLILIGIPALISGATSLGSQVMRPIGPQRASLQSSTWWQTGANWALMTIWLTITMLCYQIMSVAGVSFVHRLSISVFIAFAPSVLAYGRVMGASWSALTQSSKRLAKGESTVFRRKKPSTWKQFVSSLVHINLIAMPIVALNTLVSLVMMLSFPDMFVHSSQVLETEYRPQATIMEEGGIIGFYAIEAFSNIPEPGIRMPLIAGVLLFLLLNVALIGFLFVYEVARIMFLDIADISGRGGIKVADSRLLRSDKRQQAKVLNFCFTGFAGQSMLLLALAMITFWDSNFLPQGEACGSWEGSLCAWMDKEMLEELTWMLAAGGQIAFLFVWVASVRMGQRLEDISFDSQMSEDRDRLSGLQDMIYLKQKPLGQVLTEGGWQKAFERLEEMERRTVADIEGIEMVRRAEAKMQMAAALGRWDEAEQLGINLLALRGGRQAELAHLTIAAASLAQRDLAEAAPRLELLEATDIESARLHWISCILDPGKKTLDASLTAMLYIDPLTRRNIDLIRRWKNAEARGSYKVGDDSASRLHFLGDLARLCIQGRTNDALNRLETWMDDNPEASWTQGQVARCLMYMQKGLSASAASKAKDLIKENTHHPHVRGLATIMHREGLSQMPISTASGFDWAEANPALGSVVWNSVHTVSPPPYVRNKSDKRHAWSANAWVGRGEGRGLVNGWKQVDWSKPNPIGIHLYLYGLMVTIGGLQVDLGFPGWIDVDACEAAGLLDL